MQCANMKKENVYSSLFSTVIIQTSFLKKKEKALIYSNVNIITTIAFESIHELVFATKVWCISCRL
jgi:hypothetical protein